MITLSEREVQSVSNVMAEMAKGMSFKLGVDIGNIISVILDNSNYYEEVNKISENK